MMDPSWEVVLGRAAVSILAEAVKAATSSEVKSRLQSIKTRRAFERALRRSSEELIRLEPDWEHNLFDTSFLEHEGRSLLAQLLVPGARAPDPTALAVAWARSINAGSGGDGTLMVRSAEAVAARYLDLLADALNREPNLRELITTDLAHRTAAAVESIADAIGRGTATAGTRLDYLGWIIDRNSYIDPRGIPQTQRQVQLKLDEVYIGLSAEPELAPNTSVDRPIDSAQIVRSALRPSRATALELTQSDETTPLDTVVETYAACVILGDPGSGKTTLLKHLALSAATSAWKQWLDLDAEARSIRLPILLRIAEYAQEGRWQDESLTDFLSSYHQIHDCPAHAVNDLLTQELAAGNCLVLLDGLDEIVHPDDRRAIVGRIEDFIRRYAKQGNQFVVSSRVAGYRTAPLGEPFRHFRVLDMSDAQVHAFLNAWCPAVEEAQRPDVALEERRVTAQREIDGILDAIARSPGVGRLSVNPLLLTILALIHRTGAKLPEKRIELYKIAADTLARTWRAAQGVPESSLVDDLYLTRLLGRVAFWLHSNRSTGLASEEDIEFVLAEEWSALRRWAWDPDDPNADVMREVDNFLTAVRIQTGLFLERAPAEYGFMHLTFQEYYVARYLVARRRSAVKTLRQFVHNPRWQEPILLAIGFVGLDYPAEASELVEGAVLARGVEAEDCGLAPSALEDVLARDYLLALRCLGDQIPLDEALARELISRAVEEFVNETGAARYAPHRRLLIDRLRVAGGHACGRRDRGGVPGSAPGTARRERCCPRAGGARGGCRDTTRIFTAVHAGDGGWVEADRGPRRRRLCPYGGPSPRDTRRGRRDPWRAPRASRS